MRALKLIVTTENVDFFIDFISHVFGVYSQTDDDNLKNPAWSDYGRDCQKKSTGPHTNYVVQELYTFL